MKTRVAPLRPWRWSGLAVHLVLVTVMAACTTEPISTAPPGGGGAPSGPTTSAPPDGSPGDTAGVSPTPGATIGGQCINQTTPPPATDDPVAAAEERAMISYNAPSEWTGPESAPAPEPGKRIAIVSVGQLTEGANRAARGMEAASRAMGWEPTILDGEGQPDVILAAVNSAVDGDYDGILLIFVEPDTVSEPLNRAREQGVPVVTLGQAAYTQTRTELWGHIPDVSHDWVYTGEVIADYMIWKSDGNVNAFLLNGAETTIVNCGQFKGTFDRLHAPGACPSCTVTVQNFTIARIETQTAEQAIAAAQADPDLGWVWCYDFCLARVSTQMEAAGVARDIKGAGFDCNAENIDLIRNGTVQVVCIADPRDWEAWAAVDNLNRLIQGQDPVDQSIPVRLFDTDNVDEFTEEDIANGWQGGFDYQSQYKRIWGVQ